MYVYWCLSLAACSSRLRGHSSGVDALPAGSGCSASLPAAAPLSNPCINQYNQWAGTEGTYYIGNYMPPARDKVLTGHAAARQHQSHMRVPSQRQSGATRRCCGRGAAGLLGGAPAKCMLYCCVMFIRYMPLET